MEYLDRGPYKLTINEKVIYKKESLRKCLDYIDKEMKDGATMQLTYVGDKDAEDS